MKLWIIYPLLTICSFGLLGQTPISNLTMLLEEEYISEWKSFYPSKAVRQGFHSSLYRLEDFSIGAINKWIDYNSSILQKVSTYKKPRAKSPISISEKINLRILEIQARTELDVWQNKRVFETSPNLYSSIISHSLSSVFSAEYLTEVERLEAVDIRISAMSTLSTSAINNLVSYTEKEAVRSIGALNETRKFLSSEEFDNLLNKTDPLSASHVQMNKIILNKNLDELIQALKSNAQSQPSSNSQILGELMYAKSLALYTDTALSPDSLAHMALVEIETVRALILEKSILYLKNTYQDQALPSTDRQIIDKAFGDMEDDAPLDGDEYLSFWHELAKAAVEFIDQADIATIPKFETLRITPAPESAGAASRIGWVDSAPPFAPNPVTTLYLPSIPESLPVKEKREFWSSFNKPFNRMIVIHELYPGHYMQIKKSRESPHQIRLLFPYGPYFEGWASFCEIVALDAGWEEERPLTYLAHLRKRLENANRAYTSVMVHCKGWDKAKVSEFSAETSLLAPQFAKSLWGRLMRSPMQMTTYFLGGQQFKKLLKVEQGRLKDRFVLKDFMDTIMKSGPIPIDEFYGLFKQVKK